MEITGGNLSSDFVRRNWRDVVDFVVAGGHVVVARSGKDLVAIIPISDFDALAGQLEDLSDLRDVDRNIAEGVAAGDPVAIRYAERRDWPNHQAAEVSLP